MNNFKAIAEFYGLYLERDLGTKQMVLGNYDGRTKNVNLLNTDDFRKECEALSATHQPKMTQARILLQRYNGAKLMNFVELLSDLADEAEAESVHCKEDHDTDTKSFWFKDGSVLVIGPVNAYAD